MIDAHVTIAGHSRIDFNKRKVRKGMRQIGATIRKEGRRLVSRRGISGPGEYPGKETGELMRSIKSTVSRSGFMVRIAPAKTARMAEYYPAFLYYGTPSMAARKNFMEDALQTKRDYARSALHNVLIDALVPR